MFRFNRIVSIPHTIRTYFLLSTRLTELGQTRSMIIILPYANKELCPSDFIQTFKFGVVSHVNTRANPSGWGSEYSRGVSRPSPRTREGDILVNSSDLPRCFHPFDARCVPCKDLVG